MRLLLINWVYSRDGVDHVEAHFHAALRVIRPRLRQPAHAVVAVAQQFDPQTMVLGGQSVEPNCPGNNVIPADNAIFSV